jgi:SH3 domain-containing YSC84-like protein 1
MKTGFVGLILVLLTSAAFANNATEELDGAALVVRTMVASHQIPSSTLAGAECITVIPALAKAAVVIGGKHGNGVVSCRTGSKWSAPAFVTVTGGSVGLQAGLEHQDLVLLMNRQGERELSKGHWNLGAEATVSGPSSSSAGGPESQGWKTPVLAYTSSSGAYVGANLQGSKISMDDQTMRSTYGPNTTLKSILNGKVQPPGSAQSFLAALHQAAVE